MRVTLNHRNDMSGVVLFLLLFYTFFKIGLFGFGGGYAMLSMIASLPNSSGPFVAGIVSINTRV